MQLYGSWDNYIGSLRKQWGLSQDDLAALLDVGPKTIAGYETGQILPDVSGALALELVFEAPVFEIFAGKAEIVRQVVAARANALLIGMSDRPAPDKEQLLRTLERIAHVRDADFAWRDIR